MSDDPFDFFVVYFPHIDYLDVDMEDQNSHGSPDHHGRDDVADGKCDALKKKLFNIQGNSQEPAQDTIPEPNTPQETPKESPQQTRQETPQEAPQETLQETPEEVGAFTAPGGSYVLSPGTWKSAAVEAIKTGGTPACLKPKKTNRKRHAKKQNKKGASASQPTPRVMDKLPT